MARSPAARTGDDFRAVFERCYPKVTAYARRRVHADAVEDVVADVFTVAWRRWEEVAAQSDALPWIYGVARRVISEHYRAGSRRQRLAERLAGTAQAADAAVLELVGDDLVSAVLARLRPGDREVLMLRYWEDLSTPEMAAAVDKSVVAVRVALHRARERFRALWEQTAPDEGPSPFAGEAL